jgi:drug/metabolite transporter (DMT)-like permease
LAIQKQRFASTGRGIFWMFVTGLCFLGVTVTVRYVGTDLPAAQAAFLRYVIGTLLLLPAFMRLASGDLVIRQPWVMIVRGVAHGIGVILWFYAMARIPIAEVTALGYLTPVVVTVAAAIFLGETLHARRLIAVLAGFVGVMIIIRPGLQEISIGQLAQLATAPMFAISMLLTKKLTASNEPIAIVAVLSLVCTLTLLPPAVMLWVAPGIDDLMLLTLTAVLATVGHYTMTLAFSYAPLSALQPISFLQLIWATLAGYLLFAEPVDGYVVLGGVIIVASASYIAHREAKLGRQSTPAVQAD